MPKKEKLKFKNNLFSQASLACLVSFLLFGGILTAGWFYDLKNSGHPLIEGENQEATLPLILPADNTIRVTQSTNGVYYISVANNSIEDHHIQDKAVEKDEIQRRSIYSYHIADGQINARTIEDGSIDTRHLDSNIRIRKYLRVGDGNPSHFNLGTGDAYIADNLEVDGDAYFDETIYVRDSSSISTMTSNTLQTTTANISNILSNSHLHIKGRLPDVDFLKIDDFVQVFINPSDGTIIGTDYDNIPTYQYIDGSGDLYVSDDLEVNGTIYGTISGAYSPSGNLDMDSNLILNIGNSNTDFTSTGGLNLAGSLNINNQFFVDTATGRVGVGTTGPAARLNVQSLTSNDVGFLIKGYIGQTADLLGINNSLDSRLLTFDASGNLTLSGNVGIGTTSPTSKLHIDGTGAWNAGLVFGDGDSGIFEISDDLLAFHSAYANTMFLGSFGLRFNDNKYIGLGGSSDSIIYYTGTDTVWRLNNVGIGNLGITGGNVGIGTTNPTSLLQLGTTFDNDPVTPTLSFGNGDSGFYESADNILSISTGGTLRWSIDSTYIYDPTYIGGATLRRGTSSFTVPAHSFTSDYDTGIGRGGADILSLIAGGTNGLNIISTGNVGIGTTSPGAKLEVNGRGIIGATSAFPYKLLVSETGITPEDSDLLTTDAYKGRAISVQGNGGSYFMGRDVTNDIEFIMGTSSTGKVFLGSSTNHNVGIRTNNAERVTITTTGNVGIGTTGPEAKLQVVQDSISAFTASFINTYGGSIGSGIVGYTDDGTATGDNDRLGYFLLGGAKDNVHTLVNTAGVLAYATEAWDSSHTGTKLVFAGVPTGSATRAEWMTLKDGNVGIGTVSPGSPLHIVSSSITQGLFERDSTGDANISFKNTVDQWSIGIDGSNSSYFTISDTNDLSSSSRFTITNSGNIGIGTTSPSEKLHIAGGTNQATNMILEYVDTGVGASETLGSLYYRGGESTQTNVASITAVADSGWTDTSSPTKLEFSTTPLGSQTSAVNMVIKNNGNIGIGTTSPGAALDVYGKTQIANNGVVYWGTSANQGLLSWGTGRALIGSQSGNDLALTAGGTSEKVRITTSGNVGIGTTSPSDKLTVVGSIVARETDDGNDAFRITAGAGSGSLRLYESGTAKILLDPTSGDSYINNGNVGIGTTAPGESLDIVATNGADLKLESTNADSVARLYWKNDANTWTAGIDTDDKFKIADAYGFGANIRLTIQEDGNIGIGTTVPSAKLQVLGSDSLSTSFAANISGATGTGLVVTNNGNVGIGTTSPGGRLDVNGGNLVISGDTGSGYGYSFFVKDELGANVLRFYGDTGNSIISNLGGALAIGAGTAQTSIGAGTYLHLTSGTSQAMYFDAGTLFTFRDKDNSNAIVATIDSSTGGASFGLNNGNVGIGTTVPSAKLQVLGSDSLSTSFAANISGATGTGLVVTNNGNVGIGTTNPGEKLQVDGGASADANILVRTDAAYNSRLKFKADDSWRIEAIALNATPSNHYDFGINYNRSQYAGDFYIANNGTRNVTVQSTGNVGIGTTGPGYDLDVVGDLRVQDSNEYTPIMFYLDNTHTTGDGSSLQYRAKNSNNAYGVLSDLRAEWVDNTSGSEGSKFHIKTYDDGVFDTRFVIKEGNVGIGTTGPNRKLFVNGDAGGTTAWYNDSDERLKKDIETIPNALSTVLSLRGVQFRWKDQESHSPGEQIGFIAQETLSILPQVVSRAGEYYGMQYAPITALLVEGIKQQHEMIISNQLSIKDLGSEDISVQEKISLIGTSLQELDSQLSLQTEEIAQNREEIEELNENITSLVSLSDITSSMLSDHEMRIQNLENIINDITVAETPIDLSEQLKAWQDNLQYLTDENGKPKFRIDGDFEVEGIFKPGDFEEAPECNSDSEGGMYYNKKDKLFYGCDGRNWIKMGDPNETLE